MGVYSGMLVDFPAVGFSGQSLQNDSLQLNFTNLFQDDVFEFAALWFRSRDKYEKFRVCECRFRFGVFKCGCMIQAGVFWNLDRGPVNVTFRGRVYLCARSPERLSSPGRSGTQQRWNCLIIIRKIPATGSSRNLRKPGSLGFSWCVISTDGTRECQRP